MRSLISANRPSVMGILNVTPDSFSDGGQFFDSQKAIAHGLAMVNEGADIIDIGGESTRPGASPVTVEEELRRVIPVVEGLRRHTDVPLSVDTRHTEVMAAAIAAGIDCINDVNALTAPGALPLVAASTVSVCLYHCQGIPKTMQQAPTYQSVVKQVYDYLAERLNACLAAGLTHDRVILDPGFGFGKRLHHNLSLLKHLSDFKELGCPILVGVSRKSMFEHLLGRAVNERLAASLSAAVIAFQKGARILRVHDVQATKDALAVAVAIQQHEETVTYDG